MQTEEIILIPKRMVSSHQHVKSEILENLFMSRRQLNYHFFKETSLKKQKKKTYEESSRKQGGC